MHEPPSRGDIMVSVCCIAYNHEKYIREALDGFLMQKTDFAFEILIHDDASTDGTADIIREYEKKYPHLISALCQTENHYSRGIDVYLLNLRRARGKYIADCEGDDYWTDPYKLQKQVDYLESHPSCSATFHASLNVDAESGRTISYFRPCTENRFFRTGEIIQRDGGFFSTNSLMYRAALLDRLPDFFLNASVGDYPMMIYLSTEGDVYYTDEVMSAYRSNVRDSWTDRVYNKLDLRIKHYKEIAAMLDEVDRYTNHLYAEDIVKAKTRNQLNIKKLDWRLLISQRKLAQAKKKYAREIYSTMSLSTKTMLHLKYYFPSLYSILVHSKKKGKKWLIRD